MKTGFSDIEIEAGASGTYKGFTVDSKVKMKASRFGTEGNFETIHSLCASGSTPWFFIRKDKVILQILA